MRIVVTGCARLKGEPIRVLAHGKHRRRFTYLHDIVEGGIRTLAKVQGRNDEWDGDPPDPAIDRVAAYPTLNLQNEQSVEPLHYIGVPEQCLCHNAQLKMLPLQERDVLATKANVSDLFGWTGCRTKLSIEAVAANLALGHLSSYRIA